MIGYKESIGRIALFNMTLENWKARKSEPDLTYAEYGESCTLIVLSETIRRSLPSFSHLRVAMETVKDEINANVMAESYIKDCVIAKNAVVIFFDNGATLTLCRDFYANEISGKNRDAYSEILEVILEKAY